MGILSLLPSAQFVLIVTSLAISAGLVWGAERLTSEVPPQLLTSGTPALSDAEDWRAALEEIQLQSGITSPAAPPEEAYRALIEAAQSENVTQSAARTLFIDLSSAGAQGLGSDIPTQERLIAGALSQIDAQETAALYGAADLTSVSDSQGAMREYGNALMQVLSLHPQASAVETFRTLALAVEYDDATYFERLAPIESGYRALVEDLLSMPVPSTLVPLHLAVLNNFSRISQTLEDLRSTPEDPLRGLSGLHTFNALNDEVSRVFTTIAQQLKANAILFTKDEPGSAWDVFLSVSP